MCGSGNQPCFLPEPARSGLMDIFNLHFPLPLGPHSTPGQLSNLEVELHLSVNGGAGEVAVMRPRAGGVPVGIPIAAICEANVA